MIELLVRPLADAFMQVGVFVALLIAPFGWARFRFGEGFDALLLRHRRLGPVICAALTMPPGCGGAIVVMAVYAGGGVTYGSAIAALVATMGDASWVLLAGDPVLTLQLKALMLVTGVVTGYAVDMLGVAPHRRCDGVGGSPQPTASGSACTDLRAVAVAPAQRSRAVVAAGRSTGHLQAVGVLPAVLWGLVASGALVSLPAAFQVLEPAEVGRALLGGVDPYLALGLVGAVTCLIVFLRNGCRLADDDAVTAHPRSMSQVLRHGGYETAFVTVWVGVAYLVWSWTTQLTGFDGSQLPVHGYLGVVVGACVGLIPGCAIQIVFAGMFLAGGVPVATLVANSVSQDGDALLPLLAMERRAALLATVLTTLPALAVGSLVHVLR